MSWLTGFREASLPVRERLYKYSEGKRVSGVSVLNQKAESFIYLFSLFFMFIVILTTAEGQRQNPFHTGSGA